MIQDGAAISSESYMLCILGCLYHMSGTEQLNTKVKAMKYIHLRLHLETGTLD